MKCDVCGKFRKDSNCVKMYDDYTSWWECKYCLPEHDREMIFGKEFDNPELLKGGES